MTKLFDLIVPIGADCLPAMRLKELNLRNSSKPFDWLWFDSSVRSGSQFRTVVDLILSNFANFLCDKSVGVDKNCHGHLILRDTKSGFVFEHEDISGLKQLDVVQNKYRKRIDRLYSEIDDANSILFLYVEKNDVVFNVEDVIENLQRLHSHFQGKDITLYYFVNDESIGKYELFTHSISKDLLLFKINNSVDCSPVNDPWQRNRISLYNALLQNITLSSHLKSNDASGVPEVTVLLPTYKPDLQNLIVAINSVFNQTFSNFEILIVHDGDVSEVFELKEIFPDSRLRIVSGPGKGLAAALNYGIDQAKGQFIARMDADDIALPSRLEKQVSFLRANPDVGVVGSYQEHFGKNNYIHKPEIDPALLKVLLLFRCDLCHSTVMFNRSLFCSKNIRYPVSSPQEDFELWSSLLNTVKFANIPEVLGLYRVSGSSITDDKADILSEYEASITVKSLRKYFNYDASKFTDILTLRKLYNYPTKPHSERLLIQKRFCEFFNILERLNSSSNFLPTDSFLDGLKVCWRRQFSHDILYPCKYACDYKREKIGSFVLKETLSDGAYIKKTYSVLSIPIVNKIRVGFDLKKIYIFKIEIYKRKNGTRYLFGIKIPKF